MDRTVWLRLKCRCMILHSNYFSIKSHGMNTPKQTIERLTTLETIERLTTLEVWKERRKVGR